MSDSHLSCRRARLGTSREVRARETLLFRGTGHRRTAPGLSLISALTAALPAMTKNVVLELAPVRVKLIAAGFVDTRCRRGSSGVNWTRELGATYDTAHSTRRRPASITGLAVHVMTNSAIAGVTFDIDGGQRLEPLTPRSLRRRPPCNAESAAPHSDSTLGDREPKYLLARGDRKARADSSPSRASRCRASRATRHRSCLRRGKD
jgi:hypothetical protein